MKERILEFLRAENKTSSQFAEEIGVQPSSVSHIVSGRNKPSLDFIMKMLQRYSDLSTDWLVFGTGDMYKADSAANLFSDLESTVDENSEKKEEQADKGPVNELFNLDNNSSTINDSGPQTELEKVILIYKNGRFREYNP